jgi:hypothetical protein
MSDTDELCALLAEIDGLLDRYDPGETSPDRIVGEVIAERAAQAPLLLQAIELASQGLQKFPCHPELLRRRALARSCVVTLQWEYPELQLGADDLQAILASSPNDIRTAYDLLELQFTFSGMSDADLAEVSAGLVERAACLLLDVVALQIKALAYAGQLGEAEQIFGRWSQRFPDSERLRRAKEVADSMKD